MVSTQFHRLVKGIKTAIYRRRTSRLPDWLGSHFRKAHRKIGKAADKVDKAQSKIPKKKIKTKERTFDAETGKTKVRLHFEEVDKPKPPSKLEHGIKKAPQRAALHRVEWYACFVSWAFNQAGYSEPKFAACPSQGIPYFSS